MQRQRVIRKTPLIAVDQNIRHSKLEGILDGIRQIGWRVLDHRLHNKLDLTETEIAGIIVEENVEDLPEKFIGLQSSNTPVVCTGHFLPGGYRQGFVVNRDFPAAGKLVSSYFVSKGIRQIGVLAYDTEDGNYLPLFKAAEAEAEEHGASFHYCKYSGHVADGVNSDPSGIFAKWLEEIPKPLGIFCFSDRVGALVCRICLDLGWSIPDEISVLGLGNERLVCEGSIVPLSSIDCNDIERGRVAVALVADFHAGKRDIPKENPIPPKAVVERRSTGSDALPLRVLAFLQDNLQLGLTVEDIAEEFQVSRRTIERAFKQDRGTTVLEELRSLQFQRCCDLLTTTEISIDTITSLVGFSSKEYLQRIFRKEYGLSLRAYRTAHRGG